MANCAAKFESKGIKRRTETEVYETEKQETEGGERCRTLHTNIDPETVQCPSPSKRPSIVSDRPQVKDIETLMKDLSKEIIQLFSNYAKALSDRAAVDSQHIAEFDEIVKEARLLEAQIQQKKENLRNHLSRITKSLQK